MLFNNKLIRKLFVQTSPFRKNNPDGNKDLDYWRNIVINSLLLVGVSLGLFALIPSVWLSIKEGLYLIAAFDITIYLVVFVLYFNRNISYQIRSVGVIVGCFFVGLVLFFVIGPFGAGPIWLFAFPILAGGLRGFRAAVISIIINAITLIITGFLLAGNFLEWSTLVVNPIGKWIVISINFILLNSLASGVVTIVLSGLNLALKNESAMRNSLQKEHDQVTNTNTQLKQEINERIKAVEALRENEEKYRSLIESSDDPIYVVNRKMEYLYANQSLLKRLGKAGSDLENLSYSDFHSAQEVESFAQQINKVIESRKPLESEYQSSRDEEHFIKTLSPIVHPITNEITAVTVISKNISEHIKLEQQLQQSQKLDSIGTLAGGVAHDFNNLLTIIQGHAQLIMFEIDENSNMNKNLQEIVNASDRAAALTRQLLLFSRKEVMEFKVINVNKTISRLMKMIERLIGEDILIETNFNSDIDFINGDEGNLEQVIMNLCVNARDAMTNGGVLRIKTENVQLSKKQVETVQDSRSGNFIRISIEDNGTGIPQKIIEKIFDPFYTTKSVGKGTGLGLSVVFGIVKKHKGWINVYSEVDKGSIFKIYLPSGQRSNQTSDINIDQCQNLEMGNGEHILFIEDETGVRNFVETVLRRYGYNPISASTVESANKIFEDKDGEFDMIISDVILPDGNGYELVNRFLSKKPNIPILMCSGYTAEKIQKSIQANKKLRFLQKPYSLNALLSEVKNTILKSCKNLQTGNHDEN